MNILEVKNVSRSYKNRRKNGKKEILENVSFSIEEGKFVSIVGPSGCGKSTLIGMLAGLDKPTSGEIYIDGKLVVGPDNGCGLVFQESSLFPWLTVEQNMEFGLKVKGIKKAQRQELARHYLNMVNLYSYKDYRIHELSGGMRQRISIARVLALETKILIMDEPFVAIDAQTQSMMHDEIIKLWEKTGKTILFITHDINEAVFLSDRTVVLGFHPNNVKASIDIDLPRPRNRESKEFLGYVNEIRDIIGRCSNE
ncbi:MAG: ABC transporter ATP-binding protein [Clostridiales bacterium]|nr:ABC transporter ATP-binding protein [Clostridiales bacterium]